MHKVGFQPCTSILIVQNLIIMLTHYEQYKSRFNMYKTYPQEYFLGGSKATHAHLACMTTFRKSMIKKTHDKKKQVRRKSRKSIHRKARVYI